MNSKPSDDQCLVRFELRHLKFSDYFPDCLRQRFFRNNAVVPTGGFGAEPAGRRKTTSDVNLNQRDLNGRPAKSPAPVSSNRITA
jgi:hypothetical protein